MKYNSEIHHRQSTRLDNYDYSKEGAYFFTLCTYQRREVFGKIVDNTIQLSSQGEIAYSMWQTLPERFPGIELDAFIAMPNHVHGIVIRTRFDATDDVEKAPYVFKYQYKNFRSTSNRAQTFHEMMRTFKALVSYHIHKNGDTGFAWQRGFYDHIICNVAERDRIRSYIVNNPAKWQEDKLHPLYKQNQPM